ncbi:MAG: MATE family efflux transporter [Chloroflexi bacterium]|nr:MATE family efflux transporter [Chloroflexota bacterium]
MQTFFADRDFFATLLKLWLPIALQQLIFSLLGLVTVMMIGQLGETSVAAVGLAGQIAFLMQLFLFGIGSGAAIFVAQFWGTRDIANIRRVLGVALGLGALGASAFTFVALVVPDLALGVYSSDRAVIVLGSEFLRIAGWSYLPIALTTGYAITLRSTGHVRVPVTISVFSLGLGAVINYALIFGAFGLPALGVQGSAIGTVVARWLECGLILTTTYARQSVAAAGLRELFAFDSRFLTSVLKTMLPVAANEIVWSFGITTYSLIYGRIGTEAVAAVSIAETIQNLAYVPFVGLANAAAIMIGNRIGADEEHKAFEYATRFLQIVLALAVLTGAAIFLSADGLLGFYKIDATTHRFARAVLTVMALTLWVKASNMMYIVGVLRAGGDARVSAVIDTVPLWMIGIPLAAAGAFMFDLPVYWVYLLTLSDEVTKCTLATWRFVSKKWITNLARQHHRASEA